MTSNLDILTFLKADQDAKAKEKEEDKELRARERKEDMEHILAMIKIGVEKEVRAAIEPVEERLQLQEKVNQQLFKKINSLVLELDTLKQGVDSKQQAEAFPGLPEPQVQQRQVYRLQGQGHRVQEQLAMTKEINSFQMSEKRDPLSP